MGGKKKTSSTTPNKTNGKSSGTVPGTPISKKSSTSNNNNENIQLESASEVFVELDKEFLNLHIDQLKTTQRLNSTGGSTTHQSQQHHTTSGSKSHGGGGSGAWGTHQTQAYKDCYQDVPTLALYSFRLGNNEYYREKYTSAIEYYNTALMHSNSQHTLFLVVILINRSISKLRIHEYKKSILDSTLAISIQPNCIKAYVCRYFGYFFTRDFKKAFSDHFIAVNLCPKNITLSQIMKLSYGASFLYNSNNIQDLISKTKTPQTPSTGVNTKNGLWIDFNSLCIEEEQNRMHLLISYQKNLLNQSQQQQQQQSKKDKEKDKKTDLKMPSLIPFGEYSYGTSWSDAEEYHSIRKSNLAENWSSMQKWQGNFDFQDKNYIAALGHYTKAIKLNPDDPIYYSNRGIVYYKQERYYEAITDCTISIEKHSQQIKAYLRRGSSYLSVGDYTSAVDDFRTGLKYEPDSIDLLDGLCRALNYIEQDIKSQIITDPNSEALRVSLKGLVNEIAAINSKLTSNRFENSSSTPSSGSPNTLKSANSSANSDKDSKNTNNQAATSSKNIKQPPSNNNGAATTQPNKNNPPKESPQQQQQQQPNQNSSKPRTLPSQLQQYLHGIATYKPVSKEQRQKVESLIQFLSPIIEQKPTSVHPYVARAESHLQLGNYEKAFIDYQSALEVNPIDIDVLSRLESLKEKLIDQNNNQQEKQSSTNENK